MSKRNQGYDVAAMRMRFDRRYGFVRCQSSVYLVRFKRGPSQVRPDLFHGRQATGILSAISQPLPNAFLAWMCSLVHGCLR